MYILTTIITPLVGLLAVVLTKNVQVSVGQYGIAYVPSTISANIGDKIQFDFYNVRLLYLPFPTHDNTHLTP